MLGSRPVRLTCLAVLAGALALSGPAAAESPGVSLALSPNVAGRPSTLVIGAEGGSTSMQQSMIKSITLSVQRGFTVDPHAVRARCSAAQAKSFACPEASRIGSGQAVVTASGAIVPGGSQDFTAAIDLFLAPPVQAGDLAGVVISFHEPTTNQRGTVTGRLIARSKGPFAYELQFEGSVGDGGQLPPGVTIALKRLDLRAGARRTVIRSHSVGQGKNRHRVKRRVTLTLLRNPPRCNGFWKGQVVLDSSDGSSSTRSVTAPCRSS